MKDNKQTGSTGQNANQGKSSNQATGQRSAQGGSDNAQRQGKSADGKGSDSGSNNQNLR